MAEGSVWSGGSKVCSKGSQDRERESESEDDSPAEMNSTRYFQLIEYVSSSELRNQFELLLI